MIQAVRVSVAIRLSQEHVWHDAKVYYGQELFTPLSPGPGGLQGTDRCQGMSV